MMANRLHSANKFKTDISSIIKNKEKFAGNYFKGLKRIPKWALDKWWMIMFVGYLYGLIHICSSFYIRISIKVYIQNSRI